jgi:hypothetical protein
MCWIKNKNKKESKYVLVSESAIKEPYPYVFIEENGSVRELHLRERRFFETPMEPTDGSAPYIKRSYQYRNSFGSFRGYCLRTRIPSHLVIQPPPEKDPTAI